MRRSHGSEPRGLDSVPRAPSYEGRFGRMFRRLPTFTQTDEFLTALAEGMRQPDGEVSDNPGIPAIYTYFGQFIDHDITFDPSSSLQRMNDPEGLINFRTPRFDLDSVYGSGPADEPFQYDEATGGLKLLTGKGRDVASNQPTTEDDLPRNEQGRALIGDPRNDENVIVSQLQLAFIKPSPNGRSSPSPRNPDPLRPSTASASSPRTGRSAGTSSSGSRTPRRRHKRPSGSTPSWHPDCSSSLDSRQNSSH